MINSSALKYFALLLVLIFSLVQVGAKIKSAEDIVRKWAPLIWLSPDERYFPLSVEEFLNHVNAGYSKEELFNQKEGELPYGEETKQAFLITKEDLESLKTGPSFWYGRNPTDGSVPIYALVTHCFPSTHQKADADSGFYFHVTYWIFYPLNVGKDVCFFGKIPTPFEKDECPTGDTRMIGNHVGDWEHVSMQFTGKLYPDEIYVHVHDSGAYYTYDPALRLFRFKRQDAENLAVHPNFPPIVRTVAGRPILFAANGSHGLWSTPGDHYYVPALKLDDQTSYGIPWKTWENLTIYNLGQEDPPSWTKYSGRWGNPRTNCVFFNKLNLCEFFDGPRSLPVRKKDFFCSEIEKNVYPKKLY